MFTHIVVRYLMYAVALSISVLMLVQTAQAGVNVWQKDDSYVDVGLLIQTQGRVVDGGGAGTDANTDSIFFRRLRPFFYGAFNKNWQGIIQMDFGEGFEGQDAKTSVKWAYMEYLGLEANQQSSLKIGSFKPYFGREFLTLGPHLQTVERTFTGIQWVRDTRLHDGRRIYPHDAGPEDVLRRHGRDPEHQPAAGSHLFPIAPESNRRR